MTEEVQTQRKSADSNNNDDDDDDEFPDIRLIDEQELNP